MNRTTIIDNNKISPAFGIWDRPVWIFCQVSEKHFGFDLDVRVNDPLGVVSPNSAYGLIYLSFLQIAPFSLSIIEEN